MAVTKELSVQNQVNVGAIVAAAFDQAVKKTLFDLAEAATGQAPPHTHPTIERLGAEIQQKFEGVNRDDLLEFMGNQAGVRFSLDFEPNRPRPQVLYQTEQSLVKSDRAAPSAGQVTPFSNELFEFNGELNFDVRGNNRGDVEFRAGGTFRF